MNKILISEKQLKQILEALKDEIPDYQQKVVSSNWGDTYLKKDVPVKTENIKEGKWKLSNDDRDMFLSHYFNIDLKGVHNLVSSFKPSIHFYRTMLTALIDPNKKKFLKTKNTGAETILHNIIYLSKENIFYPIDVKAQKTGKVKLMGDDGKPVMKDGQPVLIDKQDNAPIFIKNKKQIWLILLKVITLLSIKM